jgi:hypothetical protein
MPVCSTCAHEHRQLAKECSNHAKRHDWGEEKKEIQFYEECNSHRLSGENFTARRKTTHLQSRKMRKGFTCSNGDCLSFLLREDFSFNRRES